MASPPSNFMSCIPAVSSARMLKFARDVMRTGNALPIAKSGSHMSEAVIEMSAKGVGCIGIVDAHGQLYGIITDGDLRRHMGPGLTEATVDENHDTTPEISAGRTNWSAKSIEVLNSSKITAIFVVEGTSPGRRRPPARFTAHRRRLIALNDECGCSSRSAWNNGCD